MTRVPAELRRSVLERARNCCEYCLLSQNDDDFSFHIDHIIAEKHGGETTVDNLCLSCYVCNAYKGSDISSLDRQTGSIVPLFNPRVHDWPDHFRLNGARIEPLTAQGRATVSLLRLNGPQRLAERELLRQMGRYPCPRQ